MMITKEVTCFSGTILIGNLDGEERRSLGAQYAAYQFVCLVLLLLPYTSTSTYDRLMITDT